MSKLSAWTQDTLRAIFNSCGIEVVRTGNSPRLNLLGLRSAGIGTIIDVGANIGQFARKMRKEFPEAQIFSFEPLPEPYERLRSWADMQQGRVLTFNMALGETTGTMQMNLHVNHTPSSSLLTATSLHVSKFPFIEAKDRCSISIDRLDNVIERIGVDKISKGILLKLDVQGYEDRVLRGAPNTLKIASYCMLEVVLDSLYNGQSGFLQLFELMAAAGFKYCGNLNQTYADDGHVMWLDALFKKVDA